MNTDTSTRPTQPAGDVMDAERFYATRNDAHVPTVVDTETHTQEDMPGSGMWDAKWTADHYNGKHDLGKHNRCPVCAARGF